MPSAMKKSGHLTSHSSRNLAKKRPNSKLDEYPQKRRLSVHLRYRPEESGDSSRVPKMGISDPLTSPGPNHRNPKIHRIWDYSPRILP